MADKILNELLTRRDSVENLFVEATWEEFDNGKPSKWEHETIWRDKLGRVRDRSYHGPGAMPSLPKRPGEARLNDDLFNGEITVNLIDDPALNHLGTPREPGQRPDPGDHYRCLMVHDGKFPAGNGLDSHRNPFNCMDVSLISDLSLILASKKSVTVQPVTGQQGAYELRYRLDPKHDPDGLEHRVLVDAGKGWLVTRHEQFFPDGKSARLSTCDYKRGDDGRWIPSKGQFRNLWGKDVPGLDWRFAVRRIAVNDPKFDDGVFAVKAERGVYVSDIRQLVSYWAEENIASASDLARLTRDAVARRRDGFRAPGGPNLAGPTLGRPAPDFTVKTLDGGTFRLQEQRGKCVLLYFWAAKAPPDKTELSILKYIQRKLAGHREFAMLGLCIGAPADIRRVAKEKDITWPQARTDTPSQDHVPQDYNTQGFGWVILIGPDGNVLLKRRSGAVAMNPALSELLE